MSRQQIADAVAANPSGVLLALDFDGTLSPIVADPALSFADPAAVAALTALTPQLGCVAVITGRPPLQAVQLGGFERPGLERLRVLGHYGAQTWLNGVLSEPGDSGAVASVRELLPELLHQLDAGQARIEDKDIAVAVHTRGLEPGLFERLLGPLSSLAERHGLWVEPGRQVIELRPPGVDKGSALRELVAEMAPRTIVYAGDDLGDLPAFEAVATLRSAGAVDGFCVCSASAEQAALQARADVVLDGPAAVAGWLAELASVIRTD